MRRVAFSFPLLTSSVSHYPQKRPAITGIAFVRVYAADAAASADFYGNTLGLPRQQKAAISRSTRSTIAQWLEVKPLPTPAPASRLAAVAFTTRDAAALQRYLKAHSVAIAQPLEERHLRRPRPRRQPHPLRPAGYPTPAFPRPRPTPPLTVSSMQASWSQTAPPKTLLAQASSAFVPTGTAAPSRRPDRLGQPPGPEGTDWLEYMLNVGPNPSLQHSRRRGPLLARHHPHE